MWRRNVRRARAAGVSVEEGGVDDLPEFYRLVEETQVRGGFRLGRQFEYYLRQFTALNEECAGRMRLFLARYEGAVLAAHTLNTVGPRAWYLTGGSASHGREARPGNALQWALIRTAHGLGAAEYDLRGVQPSLDQDGPEYGLLRFELGTGGLVVEGVGEWELPLVRPLDAAFRRYLARRQR
ncbi:peptidoglycan bridge formation glycyltransferase FemA/FemB family protein [Streptomyces sp. FH025]|uniref:lipid II:glycine glycyltransferase FemX n=1 Tax=Streptomyces sp. FH025 TaxID=2815937 RepID=UPI0027DB5655|nr:peptidoglycan bridge formation glycyltransferase FemA/FemB family protein [Streptomyces sp. FH025]